MEVNSTVQENQISQIEEEKGKIEQNNPKTIIIIMFSKWEHNDSQCERKHRRLQEVFIFRSDSINNKTGMSLKIVAH